MTVSSSTSKSRYTGNGVTTAFTGSFRILDEDHVLVTHTSTLGVDTIKTIVTDYTVSGVGGSSFTVTHGTAPASGVVVTLSRNVPATQEMDLVENDAMPAETLEEAFDKNVMLVQQIKEAIDRSVRFPVSDSSSRTAELPSASLRAGKVLAFDADGDVTVSTLDLSDIEAQPASAAASAAAAAASAAAAQTAETNAETAETNAETAQAAAEVAQAAAEAAQAAAEAASTGGAQATITAGENLADRDLIYQDIFNQRSGGATKWYKVDSDATGPVKISPRIGIALAAITSGNTGPAQVRPGRVTGLSGLTAGQAVYASTTAGAMTQTAWEPPSPGTQNATRLIGYAASTTELDFDPADETIFIARNSSLASAGTLVVEHFTDSGGRDRVARSYLVAGSAVQTQVSGATGTAGGNMSGGGGNAAGFDGTTSQASTAGARTASNGVVPYLGKDWGAGNSKIISGFVLYSPNNDRFQNSGSNKTLTATLYGSDTAINSGGVSLGTLSIADNATGGASYSKLSGLTTTTAYRYHWIELTEASSFSGMQVGIAELVFYEDITPYDEQIPPVAESLNSSSTNDVTVRFADASNANADTKTCFRNRTNATRDLAVEVAL